MAEMWTDWASSIIGEFLASGPDVPPLGPILKEAEVEDE